MAKTYRRYVPEQDFLLPPSLREWLPEDHLAYFVSDMVDQLDLSAITTVYEEEDRGYPPYHPVMLTKVLVYAYCVGVFSSRKIQSRLPLPSARTGRAAQVCSAEGGVYMTVSLKRSKDCDCVCHKGGVVLHVVQCCEGYVPDQLKPKPDPKPEKLKDSH
jgi:hypothetical protein